MLAMFLWTFVVMLRNIHVRVRSVLRGEKVPPRFLFYFASNVTLLIMWIAVGLPA